MIFSFNRLSFFFTSLTFLHPFHCLSLLFVMSFWLWSHSPSWLSGSLIISLHPFCRLSCFPACCHPNPQINKYSFAATHSVSQQPSHPLMDSTPPRFSHFSSCAAPDDSEDACLTQKYGDTLFETVFFFFLSLVLK